MFDHVLVPLDGSSLAECVLPHVVAVTKALDAEVTLLRAVDRRRAQAKSQAVDPLGWHMRKSEARSYLNDVAGRLQEAGLPVKQTIAQGDAAACIINYTREQDVDLIVISSHGESGLSEWNISSVVQKVILRAYTPTMIVRAYQPIPDADWAALRYDRLLVPLDGSKRAEYILPWANHLAGFHHCKLLLTHVVNRPEVPRQAPLTKEETELVDRLTELNRQSGERYLEELRSRFSSEVATRLLVSERASETLHRLVEEEDVDVVLLTAHGYSGGAKWPYGSTALNFIAYGTRPLLIVQDISREEAEKTAAEKAASEYKGH